MRPFLTIDIETSGLTKRDKEPDDPAQAWAVSIAAELSDGGGRPMSFFSILIKPEGRKIQTRAEEIHGLSAHQAEIWGVRQNAVLILLQDFAAKAQAVIGFSTLDKEVITSLLAKMEVELKKPAGTYTRKWTRPGLEFIDVQKPAAQQAVKIPSGFDDGSYKWPTLDEACSALLGESPRSGKHSAWDDVQRTRRIYLALRERGHFD